MILTGILKQILFFSFEQICKSSKMREQGRACVLGNAITILIIYEKNNHLLYGAGIQR